MRSRLTWPGRHRRFAEELRRRGTPFVLLEGRHEARLARAVAACDRVLGRPAADSPTGRPSPGG